MPGSSSTIKIEMFARARYILPPSCAASGMVSDEMAVIFCNRALWSVQARCRARSFFLCRKPRVLQPVISQNSDHHDRQKSQIHAFHQQIPSFGASSGLWCVVGSGVIPWQRSARRLWLSPRPATSHGVPSPTLRQPHPCPSRQRHLPFRPNLYRCARGSPR